MKDDPEDAVSSAADNETAARARREQDCEAAVLFYAPTYNALGGGEIWLHRISNGLARAGRGVTVIGKQESDTPVLQEWRLDVRTEFLERTAPRAARVGPTVDLRLRGVAGVVRGALARSLDAVLRGWRPRRAFTGDISEPAYRRLLSLINETIESSPAGRLVIVCTDVYTGSHLARATREGAVAVPFYVMHHNSFASISRGTLLAYRRAAEQARGFIVLTDEDGAEFRRAGVLQTLTMVNPRPAIVTPLSPRPAEKVVVWMARMTSVKAGDVALRAWALISSQFPDWELHLYGDGPERATWERLCRKLRVTRTVRFRGVTDHPLEVLARASINLLTSRFEGWPLVIAEAAAMSVPTVASNSAPGVRAQITDGVDGMLTAVGDVTGTARALAALMSNERRREVMGRRAEERSEEFGLDAAIDRWELLLDGRISVAT